MFIKSTKVVAAGLLLLGLSSAVVFAMPQNSRADETPGASSSTSTSTAKPGDEGSGTSSESEGKLTNGKLTACQKHETAIKNIMARIVDRGTKQIAVFDSIATRTETFYQKQGKTVTNYDVLVADVTSAKSKAEADLAAVKAYDKFSCTDANPKGDLSTFKTALKTEIADLQAYKLAVKNLIVAVKSAEGTTQSSSNTSTNSQATTGGQQ